MQKAKALKILGSMVRRAKQDGRPITGRQYAAIRETLLNMTEQEWEDATAKID